MESFSQVFNSASREYKKLWKPGILVSFLFLRKEKMTNSNKRKHLIGSLHTVLEGSSTINRWETGAGAVAENFTASEGIRQREEHFAWLLKSQCPLPVTYLLQGHTSSKKDMSPVTNSSEIVLLTWEQVFRHMSLWEPISFKSPLHDNG